jgi:hypothetical protein
MTTTNQIFIRKQSPFIVRIIWDTQIYYVGRMQNFGTLKLGSYITGNKLRIRYRNQQVYVVYCGNHTEYTFSSYLTGNILCPRYTVQPANAV